MPDRRNPRLDARRIFDAALAAVDPRPAVRRAVSLDGARLKILGDEFDTETYGAGVYCVALGKAARAMAAALEEVLGGKLRAGVLSATPHGVRLSERWQVFAGGHPLPNGESVAAARAAFELLRRADDTASLVVFLVSGGGSAMMEWPRDPSVTLEDLREMNRVLVNCGAAIEEINAVRRAVSAVKGGGLAGAAPRAAQVTLIVSDTGDAGGRAVASGPTFTSDASRDVREAVSTVRRYDLAARLPPPVLRSLELPREDPKAGARHPALAPALPHASAQEGPPRRHHVLLDNSHAAEAAADAARALGYAVEVARDIADQHVEEGARLLVSRLLALRARERGRAVCQVSGGEFACPVLGGGRGGRSGETVLRCALELERLAADDGRFAQAAPGGPRFVVLGAGTDGVDGNSPAAGAVCDETTVSRAHSRGLDPRRHLEASDAYGFFSALGDAVETGPTGTNVRDLRILLAS